MMVGRKEITDVSTDILLNLAYILNTANHHPNTGHDEL